MRCTERIGGEASGKGWHTVGVQEDVNSNMQTLGARGGSYHCWKYSYPHHCQKQGQHHDLWEGRGGGEAAPAEGSIRTQTCLLALG